RSMKNMDTWKFAHVYCGKLWWRIGWVLLLFSVLVQILCIHSSENIIGIVGGILCTMQCILLLVSVILTEKELKRRYG
ncbi:MAG: SdpI family protein, partial [Lachnospiraceae bacterium]|nr:SdpI family protein [Lachnospiraceae bacterium]